MNAREISSMCTIGRHGVPSDFRRNLARREGPGDEIVQDNIEPQPRRHAVRCGRPQIDRTETVSGKSRNASFGIDFRFAVSRHRVKRAGLVDHVFAGLPIVAAGRGKHKPSHPRLFGKLCDTNTGAMIDVIGKTWLEVTKRIVGECRKMQHGIEPLEVGDLYVARVLEDGRHIADGAALRERAACIEIAVETDHVVSGLKQLRCENRADIAAMSSQQNTHCFDTRLFDLGSWNDGCIYRSSTGNSRAR